VVRETYARGKYDETLLRQVIQWGIAAQEMNMDEATREQILSLVVRARVRLREWEAAEELLTIFAGRGYRSTAELKGFLYRKSNRLRDAVSSFREALRIRPRSRSNIQELATCYARLGETEKLEELTKDNADIVSGNAILLDFKIGILVSRGNFREAESAIKTLSSLPENEGRSLIRQSQIIMQRDRDFRKAYDILTGMLENDVGDPTLGRTGST
jgi:predicted Zn-dependent protease